jgi:CheY-like chemotaxis protein/CHASE3 domain sensor protein
MRSTSKQGSWLADRPMQIKILIAIGLLLGLFLISSLVMLNSQNQQEQTRRLATHTYKVMLELDQVQRAAQTRQVGVRGYMLSQTAEQLDMFHNGRKDFATHIANLRALVSDNPLQGSRVDRVVAMAAQWDREVSVPVDALRAIKSLDQAQTNAERTRVQAEYLAHRTVRIDDITALLDQMAATEQSLLATRTQELDGTLATMRAVTIVSALLCILLGISVITMTSRLITRPLRRMTDLMTRLAAHDHDIEIRQLERRDEIGEIARALQVFKQMSIDTSGQTWLKTQVADISRRLQETTSHRAFAERLTGELVPLLKAGAAMFYMHDDVRHRLDLNGSYGLRQSGRLVDRYALGEGLVGQCAQSREPILLDDVPEDYVRIHSGSGEGLPRYIALYPVVTRDRLLGVLELASFAPINAIHRHLLEELLPIVALTLENLTRTIGTQDLLEQTQQQADELRISEEAMRQQQLALRETNTALQAKSNELLEQSQRLVASEEELRVQAEELQASNEELREKTETLNAQKDVLEELQRDTEEKADELARASQYKSEFLANMSHELRTPLNSLLILSRSLADNDEGNLDGEQIESARIIHDAGSNLLRLINDILDLSKVEAGKMELSIDTLALADFSRSLGRTFAHVAQEKHLDFRVEIDPALPATIRSDAARLEQVANNLIGNAFKFTAHGEVVVRIGRPSAHTWLPPSLEGKPAIAIAVSDSGIGIPRDKFQRIFRAFEQVDTSTSRQFGGTGLGLAISRRITELLGGDIVVESETGRGSTFTVFLPEETPEAPAQAGMSSRRPATDAVLPFTPGLAIDAIPDDRETIVPGDTIILVIEDDPAFARILAEMIRRKGHRVLATSDGESGLQLATRYQPTGILLDVMLPGMDGWTVIERLKDDPRTRPIPVHFISATDEHTRGLELGAVGFLTKPVSREAIGEAFERIMHFAEGRTRHLLIVDDDADSRAAVRVLLRDDAVTIDEAVSAEEALDMTFAASYDCIVLDLGLPGMSGLEFLEELSTYGNVPPVVVYSARDLSKEESLRIRQYTDSIVVKGARSPERLLDEVSLFLHSIRGGHARAGGSHPLRPEADLDGRRVLLVDDDMRNLFALSKVLRARGLNVSMAQDGHKALKMLDEDSGIELVLMDIMMPVMDGYQTTREIRTRPQLATLPIIALTAKAMRGDREKCLEAGANDYLSKPIDVDRLMSMMRVWLPS